MKSSAFIAVLCLLFSQAGIIVLDVFVRLCFPLADSSDWNPSFVICELAYWLGMTRFVSWCVFWVAVLACLTDSEKRSGVRRAVRAFCNGFNSAIASEKTVIFLVLLLVLVFFGSALLPFYPVK